MWVIVSIQGEVPQARLYIMGMKPQPRMRTLAGWPGMDIIGGDLRRAAADGRRHTAQGTGGRGHGQSGRLQLPVPRGWARRQGKNCSPPCCAIRRVGLLWARSPASSWRRDSIRRRLCRSWRRCMAEMLRFQRSNPHQKTAVFNAILTNYSKRALHF